MKIQPNESCRCESGKKYKRCCGESSEIRNEVSQAIHELGHISSLPANIDAHISFCNPCSFCEGDEGDDSSGAHTGYPERVILEPADDIVYSLAGVRQRLRVSQVPQWRMVNSAAFLQAWGMICVI
jgi:hypothetical protein